MIQIKNSAATQLTIDNELTDWKVTLDGEVLYTLPSNFTVQDTFAIRRIIEKMMDYAYEEGMNDMKVIKDKKIEQILETGNNQLDALTLHNDNLAFALAECMEADL